MHVASRKADTPAREEEARAYLKSKATYRGLDALGMLSDAKGDGFARLANCPWHENHSAGDDTAVFNPETKQFNCKHGGCEHRNGSSHIAEWVHQTIMRSSKHGPEAWARIVKETSPFKVLVPGIDTDMGDDEADNDNTPLRFR